MYRSHTCGELRSANINQTVTLAGWVQKVRNLGAMAFIDLRDRYGITQLVVEADADPALVEAASGLGREYVIQVEGTVVERSSKNPKRPTGEVEVKLEALKDESVPALITLSEESRRMEDMMKMYASMGMSMGGDFPAQYTLIVNSKSPLIERLIGILESDNEKAKLIASEIYRLALISQRHLTAEELKSFLSDSFKLLGMI